MKKKLLTILAVICLAAAFTGTAMAKEMVQEKCPIMGYQPNEKLYTDYKGKRIYFCCPSCPEQFKKDPEKYMQKLKEQGVELQDAPDSDSE
ncbi:YHS domain-containing protein [Desulfohalovibrio reitneri]|uniref:YHS domain-containing protein n=1 Tax=Desulfohalovibrio reitneri TaxID=1307759 RepID=UPI0004A73DE0|nr:YHS domain-containing protein [Desulfohalovibrio reitneri]